MRALTPEEIATNEKLAKEIKSKPWFSAASQNPHPIGSIQRHDLDRRTGQN